jgi:hypothetical protein
VPDFKNGIQLAFVTIPYPELPVGPGSGQPTVANCIAEKRALYEIGAAFTDTTVHEPDYSEPLLDPF